MLLSTNYFARSVQAAPSDPFAAFENDPLKSCTSSLEAIAELTGAQHVLAHPSSSKLLSSLISALQIAPNQILSSALSLRDEAPVPNLNSIERFLDAKPGSLDPDLASLPHEVMPDTQLIYIELCEDALIDFNQAKSLLRLNKATFNPSCDICKTLERPALVAKLAQGLPGHFHDKKAAELADFILLEYQGLSYVCWNSPEVTVNPADMLSDLFDPASLPPAFDNEALLAACQSSLANAEDKCADIQTKTGFSYKAFQDTQDKLRLVWEELCKAFEHTEIRVFPLEYNWTRKSGWIIALHHPSITKLSTSVICDQASSGTKGASDHRLFKPLTLCCRADKQSCPNAHHAKESISLFTICQNTLLSLYPQDLSETTQAWCCRINEAFANGASTEVRKETLSSEDKLRAYIKRMDKTKGWVAPKGLWADPAHPELDDGEFA